LWAAIAIVKDRHKKSNLFIEDADVIPATQWVDADNNVSRCPTRTQVETQLQTHLRNVTKSIVLCGQDQNVLFSEIFAGVKFIFADEDEWGCALACAPYVTLARNAVPAGKSAASIIDMTITEWEKSVHRDPLPPAPKAPQRHRLERGRAMVVNPFQLVEWLWCIAGY